MIKEKKKKIKEKKSLGQILLEYVRTVFVSFVVAFIFTVTLSFHARSEMIKDLYSLDAHQLM